MQNVKLTGSGVAIAFMLWLLEWFVLSHWTVVTTNALFLLGVCTVTLVLGITYAVRGYRTWKKHRG